VPGELVLLHGFTQTGRSWTPVIAELGERYRAFAPDLPGHGSFADRRPADTAACVAYLRALRAPQFALAGYSMGGRVALRAALELPGRIARLVLISCGPGIADAGEREARRAADATLAARIEAMPLEAFVEEWAAQPLLALPRGMAALAREDRLRNTPAGLAAALRGLGQAAFEPMWDLLAELRTPVTILAGERDEKYAAIARAMAERIARAEVTVVPDAGHVLPLERPDAVADAILRGAPGPAARP
jgi:2-succinyl-6-hydroxy-2,4-cyclohexadiene-1-carboxylate synthase